MQFSAIGSPEFINLQPLDINPLMSSCEIKILYLEENRNHSYISKEVATEMAKKFRGAPIVGYYRKDVEDFGDHGERIIFENGEVRTECLTVPYGFVSPDAKVWFQQFEETDNMGNTTIRTYMMTTGYIWTGQFEEARCAVENDGRPQSMELDKDTLQGNWSKNIKSNMDFFIISDAIISKLCILGEDVEPCFEGANVTAPDVSVSFTLDDEFKNTLMNMMQELRYALEGGKEKMTEDVKIVEETPVVKENLETVDNVEQTETVEIEKTTEDTTLTAEETQTPEVVEETTAEFVKKDDEKEKEDSEEKEEKPADNKEEKTEDKEEKKDSEENDEDKKKKNFALLEEKYAELESKFAALESECESLRQFKAEIEDAKKDELIAGFYMLDEDDIKDIKANKSNFTLDEIESKLSVIYTRKSMSVEKETEVEEKIASTDVTTYNLAEDVHVVPDWIKAVRETEEEMKY